MMKSDKLTGTFRVVDEKWIAARDLCCPLSSLASVPQAPNLLVTESRNKLFRVTEAITG